MRLASAAVVAASLVLLLSACSQAGAPGGSGAPSGATRIEVRLSDELKMTPSAFTVKTGTPVTFVVSNGGALNHEFFVGDDKAQADHEKEMAGMSAMTMDEPSGIGLKPGETKELTITFRDAGTMFAGCHIPGHYTAGMKAVITVQ